MSGQFLGPHCLVGNLLVGGCDNKWVWPGRHHSQVRDTLQSGQITRGGQRGRLVCGTAWAEFQGPGKGAFGSRSEVLHPKPNALRVGVFFGGDR